MKNIRGYIALLLVAAIAAGAAGCGAGTVARAADLMEGIEANRVAGRPTDGAFTASMADFSIGLFRKSVADNKNSLISPLSVMLALAMTANGADGETLAQMEALLGGDIPLDELNEYLYSYIGRLPSTEKSKLSIANSIWFRDDEGTLQVKADFLQRNADYYGASLYSAAFDSQTVRDVNNWVKANTDGMIDSILERIGDDVLMFLINAVAFDAEWQRVYNDNAVREGEFTNIFGDRQRVDFMYSSESRYLDDGLATGFIKPYVGGRYAFAALLPNEGVSIEAYIASLTGDGFISTLSNSQGETVHASMPKFEFEYDISMVDALKALGMIAAFDDAEADFSRMASSSYPNIFIDEVLHKTFISVDELGTRAGAVTMVVAAGGGVPQAKVVHLDRPFVFAIIDTETNLPLFIGTLLTV